MNFSLKHSFLEVFWAHCDHEDFIRPLVTFVAGIDPGFPAKS